MSAGNKICQPPFMEKLMKSEFPRLINLHEDPTNIGKRQWPVNIRGGGWFYTGDIFATHRAWNHLVHGDVTRAIFRHVMGDWGDCGPEAVEANQCSLTWGGRIETYFHDANGTRFSIRTQRETEVTTIFLPEDF